MESSLDVEWVVELMRVVLGILVVEVGGWGGIEGMGALGRERGD